MALCGDSVVITAGTGAFCFVFYAGYQICVGCTMLNVTNGMRSVSNAGTLLHMVHGVCSCVFCAGLVRCSNAALHAQPEMVLCTGVLSRECGIFDFACSSALTTSSSSLQSERGGSMQYL